MVIGKSADIQRAASNIMAGKTMNAGQICLAPDYVFLPEESRDDCQCSKRIGCNHVSEYQRQSDYTSVVNERHFERLNGYLDDARTKGAQLVEINPANEDFSQQEHHRIAPTIVLDPSDDMKVMQDEIFGPILPVKQYKDLDEPLDYINSYDRPLGLYY